MPPKININIRIKCRDFWWENVHIFLLLLNVSSSQPDGRKKGEETQLIDFYIAADGDDGDDNIV